MTLIPDSILNDFKKKGLEFEARITSSIRKALPDNPVFRNPNIKGTKGFDVSFLKDGKYTSVEIKDTSKPWWYLSSRVSKEERSWMNKVDRHGGISLLIARIKEAGNYLHYAIPWQKIKDQVIVSPPVLRNQGAVKFKRVKGKNEYDLKEVIHRFVNGIKEKFISKPEKKPQIKKDKHLLLAQKTQPASIPTMESDPVEYKRLRNMDWQYVVTKYFGYVPGSDQDEEMARSYNEWRYPHAQEKTIDRYVREWMGRYRKYRAVGEKIKERSAGRPFGGEYNKNGIYYRVESNESDKHANTVVHTLISLKDHGVHAISGNPVRKGRGLERLSPDVVTARMVNGRKQNIAVEVLSGGHSKADYIRRYGYKYDKIIFLKPQDVPKTPEQEKQLENYIWNEVKKGLNSTPIRKQYNTTRRRSTGGI